MNLQDGPVILRKVHQKPRSRSQNRGNQSISVRTLNSGLERSSKIQKIQQEVEREKKAKETPIVKYPKPAIRHRREPQIWDDEGNLVSSFISSSMLKDEIITQQKKSNMHKMNSPNSNSIWERAEQSPPQAQMKPPQRARSVSNSPRKKESVNGFFDRQRQSHSKREQYSRQEQEKERQQHSQSFMNDKSQTILKNLDKRIKKREIRKAHYEQAINKNQRDFDSSFNSPKKEEEPVKRLPIQYANAQRMVHEINYMSQRMENEMKEMEDVTFTPDVSQTEDSIKMAKKNEAQIIERNRQTRQRIVQEILDQEMNQTKHIKYAHETPKRTKYMRELLSELL